MSAPLHTHVFGPADGPVIVAVHGLTGHGKRWGALADGHLPEYRVIAPDLLGHGRSPAEPPWGIADHAAALAGTIDELVPDDRRPVIVLAHSFGSAVGLRLAADRPDLVRALILLDPAQGLDPEFALTMATGAAGHRGYPDAESAGAAKRAEGWSAVPDDVLDDELAEHLVPTSDGVDWRVCLPAAVTAWSEMARPALLPPPGVPTHVVVADRVQPPFVTPGFLERCAAERADSVTVHHVDTEHMVPFLAPEKVAGLVREVG
ncbi:MAG: alpha/beta fold hydrolase [Gordonia sp. (in: high G+C Gram-positive bacteria)]|uniref:alpha/beta fold hydrolase n=1 Tax=Gordonia sp. (in: high G+C Gram-positive bacteria) TaxID=84139 RepID=UPI0039E6FE5E